MLWILARKNGDYTNNFVICWLKCILCCCAEQRTIFTLCITSLNFAFGSHMIVRQKQCLRCYNAGATEWTLNRFSGLSVHFVFCVCLFSCGYEKTSVFLWNVEKSIIVTVFHAKMLEFVSNLFGNFFFYFIYCAIGLDIMSFQFNQTIELHSHSHSQRWSEWKKNGWVRKTADDYSAVF